MKLADIADEPATVLQPGPKCSLRVLLETLDTDDVAALSRLLDGHQPSSEVARKLSRVGHKVSAVTVARHRRGDCACG